MKNLLCAVVILLATSHVDARMVVICDEDGDCKPFWIME